MPNTNAKSNTVEKKEPKKTKASEPKKQEVKEDAKG
jgi:hypothetical protein